MARTEVKVAVDDAAIQKALARIAAYDSPSLNKRAKKVFLSAAKLLVGPMRRTTPRGRTGNLRRSVTARANRTRGAEIAAATVGPKSRPGYHRHLIILGHRIVTPGGRDTGRRTEANPFVERTWTKNDARIKAFIAEQVTALGSTGAIR